MADGTGVVFDRSRITHGEMKRVQLMQIEIRRAQESLDADKADEKPARRKTKGSCPTLIGAG